LRLKLLNKISLSAILLLTISCIHTGCGVYGFRGNNPPPGINSLYVPTFVDASGFSDPTLPELLTQRLKDKILSDNTFTLRDRSIADGEIKCVITGVRDEALVIGANETVSKRKLTISISADLDNLKTQRNLWKKSFENWGEYVSSDQSFSNREIGVRSAVERVSEDIVIELTSNW
jgi:hypothetical protein